MDNAQVEKEITERRIPLGTDRDVPLLSLVKGLPDKAVLKQINASCGTEQSTEPIRFPGDSERKIILTPANNRKGGDVDSFEAESYNQRTTVKHIVYNITNGNHNGNFTLNGAQLKVVRPLGSEETLTIQAVANHATAELTVTVQPSENDPEPQTLGAEDINSLTAGQHGTDVTQDEKLQTERRHNAAATIQRAVRKYSALLRANKLQMDRRRNAVIIQRYVRAYCASRAAENIRTTRRHNALVTIQRAARAYCALQLRADKERRRNAAVTIQRAVRTYAALQMERRHTAAVIIQRAARDYLHEKRTHTAQASSSNTNTSPLSTNPFLELAALVAAGNITAVQNFFFFLSHTYENTIAHQQNIIAHQQHTITRLEAENQVLRRASPVAEEAAGKTAFEQQDEASHEIPNRVMDKTNTNNSRAQVLVAEQQNTIIKYQDRLTQLEAQIVELQTSQCTPTQCQEHADNIHRLQQFVDHLKNSDLNSETALLCERSLTEQRIDFVHPNKPQAEDFDNHNDQIQSYYERGKREKQLFEAVVQRLRREVQQVQKAEDTRSCLAELKVLLQQSTAVLAVYEKERMAREDNTKMQERESQQLELAHVDTEYIIFNSLFRWQQESSMCTTREWNF
eukprot:TRINITY_DN64372_c0_g1_i2.p1 TRINITY_DN64372_c0_g1~~TRINITY_DN64372_c0_g1_i2.p1  ORF type:complete len:717 (+),score=74.14 TRINITY_DN64372_c0_g1_i2:273-2153(+)